MLDRRGSIPGKGTMFLFSAEFRLALGAHPSFWSMGTGGCFRVENQPGRDADHSLASSAEVKNGESVPPLLHIFSWYNY
jgi:hypothetical protein